MVATRRGTRVGSPVKYSSDENSGATQLSPSSRRTRRRTLMEENQSQAELTGDSQPDEPKDDSTASSLAASRPTRDTRRSMRLLADKKQPDSTHEADVSESESSCSVVSDVQATPRTRRRTVVREKRAEQDEVSEAESCSSAMSPTHSRRAPRSLRKRVLTSAASKDAQKVDDDDDPSGAESCSSAVSVTKLADTHRITRSHRKTAVPTTEEDPFEPESCSSNVSGSVVRRSARNQKLKMIKPIPLSLEETTDTPSSPVSRRLRDRRHKSGIEDDEYDSDGCKSGPSMSPWRSTRRQAKLKTLVDESDSESVATDVCTSQGSPSPQRGRGTPCSSRTGSASSARAIYVTRTRSRVRLTSDVDDTAAMLEEQKEGEEREPHESIPVPDGDKAEDTVDQLDSTMTMDTSEAQEFTMIEEKAEDTTIVLDEDEPIEMLEPQSSMQDIKPVEDSGTKTLTPQEEPVAETATLTEDREEPGEVSLENNEPEFVETSHVVVEQTSTDEPKDDSTASSLAASRPKRDTRRSMRFLADKKQPDSTHEADVSESESCCSVVSDVQASPRARRRTVVREKGAEQDEVSEAESCSSTMSPTHSRRAPRSLRKRVLTSEASKDAQKVDDDDEKPEPQSSMQDLKEEDPVPAVIEEIIKDQRCSEPVEEDMVEAAAKDEQAVVEKATEDQKCSEPVTEDTVETAPTDLIPVVGEEHEEMAECERKGVIVIEEDNDTVTTTEVDSVTLKDLEGPSTSSHTQAILITSKELPPQKDMISLLDSSEDEDSADEGLSSEEEGRSQEAEDVDREDDVMCPDGNRMSEEAEAHGNGLFVIDTRPGLQPEEQYYVDAKQIEEEDDFVDEEGDDEDDDSKILFNPKKQLMQLSSTIDPGLKMKELGGLYISFDGNKPKNISKTKNNPNNQDKLLKKSVIVPDFEKKEAVPPYKESKNAVKLKRKAEREKTSGSGWFNMKAPEVTEELKNDLKALKMRSAMDPKRFYKKNDREGFPKYFQVGTVVDSPVDFYNSRIPKKQRKRTIVEELLADAEFRSYNKRKYQEIMTEKAAQAAGKMNKKHKFHKKKMNK